MSRFSALAVHAQPEVLGELVAALRSDMLHVDTARSADEALAKLAAGNHAMLLVGHCPPGLDGLALLERSMTLAPDALRVLLVSTAHAGAGQALDQALWQATHRSGSGPIAPAAVQPMVTIDVDSRDRDRLRRLLQGCVEVLRFLRDQRTLAERLGPRLQVMGSRVALLDRAIGEGLVFADPVALYQQLRAASHEALRALGEAIEAKDPYTKGHCGRVAAYSLALAQEIGFPGEQMETLEIGAFLHDIGKIGIRDTVLCKPGPLDEDEWRHMREHVTMGCEIVAEIDMLAPVLPAVRSHHERWDGSGYPDGIEAEDIPLIGRLVAIADAYDAMATDRPYKNALPLEECERLLRRTAGTMYDPALVEVFIGQRIGALYRTDYDHLD